jgi:hypothetical protein
MKDKNQEIEQLEKENELGLLKDINIRMYKLIQIKPVVYRLDLSDVKLRSKEFS